MPNLRRRRASHLRMHTLYMCLVRGLHIITYSFSGYKVVDSMIASQTSPERSQNICLHFENTNKNTFSTLIQSFYRSRIEEHWAIHVFKCRTIDNFIVYINENWDWMTWMAKVFSKLNNWHIVLLVSKKLTIFCPFSNSAYSWLFELCDIKFQLCDSPANVMSDFQLVAI